MKNVEKNVKKNVERNVEKNIKKWFLKKLLKKFWRSICVWQMKPTEVIFWADLFWQSQFAWVVTSMMRNRDKVRGLSIKGSWKQKNFLDTTSAVLGTFKNYIGPRQAYSQMSSTWVIIGSYKNEQYLCEYGDWPNLSWV